MNIIFLDPVKPLSCNFVEKAQFEKKNIYILLSLLETGLFFCCCFSFLSISTFMFNTNDADNFESKELETLTAVPSCLTHMVQATFRSKN